MVVVRVNIKSQTGEKRFTSLWSCRRSLLFSSLLPALYHHESCLFQMTLRCGLSCVHGTAENTLHWRETKVNLGELNIENQTYGVRYEICRLGGNRRIGLGDDEIVVEGMEGWKVECNR